jgi:hypothetical protein
MRVCVEDAFLRCAGPRVHCRHVTRGLTPQRAGNGSAALRETLTLWKADPRYAGDADYVIATATGRKANPSNVRRDALAKEVTAADVELAKHGVRPIGHEDVRFTLNVYAHGPSTPTRCCPRCGRSLRMASSGRAQALIGH